MKELYTLNHYLRKEYGEKVYRIALDGGMTCPTRDGTLGNRGCIFCSAGGSGEFAGDCRLSVSEQISEGKKLILKKVPACKKFIAYFQAFTNTYAPVERLKVLFEEAIDHDDIVVLAIATRPDCIGDDVLKLLTELNSKKPVWVELGLQSIHPETAGFIRRGFDLKCYDETVERLSKAGIKVVTHVIFGFPGESREQMLETVRYVCEGNIFGIKLQVLQVLSGTDLAIEYERNPFHLPTLEEYASLVADAVKIIPEGIVVHRITGDPPKKLLIAPLWTTDKKRVLNTLACYIPQKKL